MNTFHSDHRTLLLAKAARRQLREEGYKGVKIFRHSALFTCPVRKCIVSSLRFEVTYEESK